MDIDPGSPPRCTICGSLAAFRFSAPCDWRKPDLATCYQIYWCAQCDFGFVWQRPSAEEISGHYAVDKYYTHALPKTVDGGSGVTFFDRLRVHLAWRIDTGKELVPTEIAAQLRSTDPSLCEIGCGNGHFLSRFRAAGFTVHGVEPDASARIAAKQISENVFDGTAEHLPDLVRQREYDVVLMSHVLEHCLDVNAALTNANAILKKGGLLILGTPNCGAMGFKSYEGQWPWSDVPRHLNFFTESSLRKSAEKHGFVVEQLNFHGFCRQFSNDWLTNEEEIWSAFSRFDKSERKRPHFRTRAWKLLFQCALASKADKYDSMWLVGIKT